MRTRRGLPFVTTRYMILLLEGIIARVQRNQKVILCHYLWMGNHAHIIIVARDSRQATAFYGEIQKQLTDAVKQLLGAEHLNLWEKNGTSVVKQADAAGVADRIAYLYANPSAANLVDHIEHYPGANTWEAYQAAEDTLQAEVTRALPWVQKPMIDELPRKALNQRQDQSFTQRLRTKTKRAHVLKLSPNLWMKTFGITDQKDIQAVNKEIVADLRQREEASRFKRARQGWKTKGARRLCEEALSLDYRPEKKGPKLFVYAKDKETRISMIEEYKRFCAICTECYEKWKQGDFTVTWPPGAFQPAPPPVANYFYQH